MRIDRLNQNVGSGALFLVFGLFGLWFGRHYQVGTATEMGPGYFPRVLSIILIVMGVALLAKGLIKGGTAIERIYIKPLFFVSAGLLLFGALVEGFGLIPASLVLVIVGAIAGPENIPRDTLLLAIGLSVVVSALFIYLLGLPLPYIAY